MASFIPRKGPGGTRVWQAHVRRRGHPAQVRTFDTKAEAEAWAATIESEIARGVFVSRAEAENTTLAEALDRYVQEVLPSKKSARSATYHIRNVRDVLGRLPLASVTSSVIAKYRDTQTGKGYAP